MILIDARQSFATCYTSPKPRHIEALTSLRSSATPSWFSSTTKSRRPRKLSRHGCRLTEPNRCSSTALTGSPLDGLQPPTEDEVRQRLSTMPNKSSPVDCIPTSVVKSWADVFAALITQLAKLSFSEGKFPSVTKQCSSPHS